MLPPTYITLRELAEFATVTDVLAATLTREITFFDGTRDRP